MGPSSGGRRLHTSVSSVACETNLNQVIFLFRFNQRFDSLCGRLRPQCAGVLMGGRVCTLQARGGT